ncbi:hypothetical protein NP233_g9914 [Leucocoprinus birnbaumii]|uniref:F-box domain-containing protein n=1 Tax=Leucocoprinus birnbaumii TaxID=56174 RepID=A0AAD5VN33_9AGAR|nr:hypothetical protein NP233_g9914 [Leucocoprinus birnbaumii]
MRPIPSTEPQKRHALRARDLLAVIFEWVVIDLHLPDDPVGASNATVTLSQVSRLWRDVVRGLPRLWQVITLDCWFAYDPVYYAETKPEAGVNTNAGPILSKLQDFIKYSCDLPLAIRFRFPARLTRREYKPSKEADHLYMYILYSFLYTLYQVTDRIDQITFISTDERSMDALSCILNFEAIAEFDPLKLFLHARQVQFLFQYDLIEEIPFKPLGDTLPASITELILIRPIHQWWHGFFSGSKVQLPRVTDTTAVTYQRPLIMHASPSLVDHYFVRLLDVVSGTLRCLEIRDDDVCVDSTGPDGERPQIFEDKIQLRLDNLLFVCMKGRYSWMVPILNQLTLVPGGIFEIQEYAQDIAEELREFRAPAPIN